MIELKGDLVFHPADKMKSPFPELPFVPHASDLCDDTDIVNHRFLGSQWAPVEPPPREDIPMRDLLSPEPQRVNVVQRPK